MIGCRTALQWRANLKAVRPPLQTHIIGNNMTTVEVIEKIGSNAQAVWNILGDFGGIKAGGHITEFSLDGEGVGAVRTITMGGTNIVERLEEFDPEKRSLKYALLNDDSPLPVSQYSATIEVISDGEDACTVKWIGSFEPKGVPKWLATKAVRSIYTRGIARAREETGG